MAGMSESQKKRCNHVSERVESQRALILLAGPWRRKCCCHECLRCAPWHLGNEGEAQVHAALEAVVASAR